MERPVRRSPERTVEAVARVMSGTDAEIVRRPQVRQALASVIAEAFRQGGQVAATDVVLLGRPWGFHLAEIHVPVHLWQGEADVLVPPSMGRHQAEQIPNCHARFFPGEGLSW
jgi:pimeloyl-ACP methyl ester carboxylesterase